MPKDLTGDLLFLRRKLPNEKELIVFCKMHGLSTIGTKEDLEKRIVYYLKTGRRIDPIIDEEPDISEINFSEKLGENFTLEDKNRDFFREYVGENFDEEFIKWLDENPDSTYEDALNKYLEFKKKQ
ncbi:hypothetical protein IV49_GL000467 [Kandleria vitulina DSM 20405]|uniref:DUF6434 domain-containing protein n=1 Tax=Kandleria vitulina DSM 20405 TaxID=1410657 RepID=A0A0R2HEM8_9FIRM|nr:DUF6434 domain-containing protein [Kandleria vitulina]KRN50022.1 hypothetical protein IV49_GL000467 [Kandleria vitulina DSM 20405]